MMEKEAQEIFDTVMSQMDYLYGNGMKKEAAWWSNAAADAAKAAAATPSSMSTALYAALLGGGALGAYGLGRAHQGSKDDWNSLKYGLGGYAAGLGTPYAYNLLTGKGASSLSNLAQRFQGLLPGGAPGQQENLPFADFTSI